MGCFSITYMLILELVSTFECPRIDYCVLMYPHLGFSHPSYIHHLIYPNIIIIFRLLPLVKNIDWLIWLIDLCVCVEVHIVASRRPALSMMMMMMMMMMSASRKINFSSLDMRCHWCGLGGCECICGHFVFSVLLVIPGHTHRWWVDNTIKWHQL